MGHFKTVQINQFTKNKLQHFESSWTTVTQQKLHRTVQHSM